MNLQGLQDTEKTEAYFWKVCGTIGFAIMLAVTLWVGRHRVVRQIQRVTMVPV